MCFGFVHRSGPFSRKIFKERNTENKEGVEEMHDDRIALGVAVILIAFAFILQVGAADGFTGFLVREKPDCNDHKDNDKDGLIDYPYDPSCKNKKDTSEKGSLYQCDDGKDNDKDKKTDYRVDGRGDQECEDPMDTSESWGGWGSSGGSGGSGSSSWGSGGSSSGITNATNLTSNATSNGTANTSWNLTYTIPNWTSNATANATNATNSSSP